MSAASILYLIGHPSALFEGVKEGDVNYAEIAKLGNFGLGTFNNIQGEMVALDGKFYQIGENGKTVEAKSEWKTPFAQVIFFHPTLVLEMRNIADYSQLKENVSAHFKNKNIPYVLRFEGYFDSLTLRSRTPHSVMKNKTSSNEAIYEASNIEGTLVGFWFPHYLLNIGIPGFHLHFIAKDRQFSGHVLDLKCAQTQFALQPAMTVNLIFPNTQEFATADISVPTLEKYKKIQM